MENENWIPGILGIGAILGMLAGFSMGLIVQQHYDKELFFIENNHLENRTCVNQDYHLSYCREMAISDCQQYALSLSCPACYERYDNITYSDTMLA